VIDEEEPAESMMFDQCQFLPQPAERVVARDGVRGIALVELRPAQLGQGARGGRTV
jgi:hypothetical protein